MSKALPEDEERPPWTLTREEAHAFIDHYQAGRKRGVFGALAPNLSPRPKCCLDYVCLRCLGCGKHCTCGLDRIELKPPKPIEPEPFKLDGEELDE